ncbi:hypothetical protein MMEU_4820 [Mycobacterium marinum str. Europe]|nr:hypothetical protein MMEU_4820 [Mycobacterium marinum str. Europe]
MLYTARPTALPYHVLRHAVTGSCRFNTITYRTAGIPAEIQYT